MIVTAALPSVLPSVLAVAGSTTESGTSSPEGWAVGLSIAVFVGAYVLIAGEWVHRVKVSLGGAALMLLIGSATSQTAFFSEETGIDWNVIFLLLGMMVVVGITKETGLFEYIAIWSAKRARGRPYRVMVLLCLLTAVASALLDNVTTVLLFAPVTILVCSRIRVRPEPFLIAEAMASNIGGTATLIGDPPNLIIASRSGLSFNDFLVNLAPLIVILLVVFTVLIRFLFRSAFRPVTVAAATEPAADGASGSSGSSGSDSLAGSGGPASGVGTATATAAVSTEAEVMKLDERQAIRDVRLMRRCLVVLGLILLGFMLRSVTGLEPSVVALLGAGLLIVWSGSGPREFLAEVEWETLVFFAGLFVMVGSLVNIGVIDWLGEHATEAVGSHYLIAVTALLIGSAVLSGVVDNIPFVATMAPLVQGLAAQAGGAQAHALWWALALGADLGGNATAVGASANVVVIGIAARQGYPISFWRFTRYGLVVTAITVAISWPYLWIRYFLLG